jgi:hypothetical protein
MASSTLPFTQSPQIAVTAVESAYRTKLNWIGKAIGVAATLSICYLMGPMWVAAAVVLFVVAGRK